MGDLGVTCSVREHSDRLEVDFEIVNGASAPVNVYDHGKDPLVPALVCDAEDGAVNFVVGIPPAPFVGNEQTLIIPSVTVLGPGQKKQGHLSLPAPLEERHQFLKLAADGELRSMRRVRVIVDFSREGSGSTFDTMSGKSPVASVSCEAPLAREVSLRRIDESKSRQFGRRLGAPPASAATGRPLSEQQPRRRCSS